MPRSYRHNISVDVSHRSAVDTLMHRGIPHFGRSKKEFDTATRVSELLSKAGLVRRAVSGKELSEIERTLKGVLYGGFYTPSDFSGDVHKFTTGLLLACERLGLAQRFSTEVPDIIVAYGAAAITSRNLLIDKNELLMKTNEQCCGIHYELESPPAPSGCSGQR